MRVTIIILLLILGALPTFAQNPSDSSKHLSFKGVPINGTLESYVAKMKAAGFAHKGTSDGAAVLEGDFASYRNCTIAVYTLKQKNLVSKIGVLFPDRDNWSSLSGNYFDLKQMLTEKYGKPSESVEKFQDYTSDSDGSKMTSVQLGSCEYYSIFETPKGTIQLSIDHMGVRRCFVRLLYMDKINGEVVKKQALDDL